MTMIDDALLYGGQSALIETIEVDGQTIQCHQSVVAPLSELLFALERENLPVKVVSDWRSFKHQANIWNQKWLGKRPLLDRSGQRRDAEQLSDSEKFDLLCHWSAVPGSSRHHWGTDFDIFLKEPINKGYQVELVPAEFHPGNVCFALEQWLTKRLSEFDFFRPYQLDLGGVATEPWHISFKPVSEPALFQFDRNMFIEQVTRHPFEGHRLLSANVDEYLTRYVFNINKD